MAAGDAATRPAYFFAAVLRAVVRRRAGLRVVRDFAAAALAGLRAVVLRAVVLRAVVFRAVLLRAVVFRAVVLRAVVFLAVVFRLAGALFAAGFLLTAIRSLPPVFFLDYLPVAPTVRSSHSCYRSSHSGNTSPTES